MSIDATNWAWSQRDITPTEKLILLSFADRAGESHEAWPSWRRLIIDTGLDRKTIYYNLKSLQEKGKIIKTGEKKRQVCVYRLLGVTGRDDKKLSTTRSNNGTSAKNTTSSNNGTGTSSNNGTGTSSDNGTGTSSNNGTWNPKQNPKRNPKVKPLSFSSFSSFLNFKTFVTEEVIETGKVPTDDIVDQILFYADKSKDNRDQVQSVNIAIALLKKGKWNIPHGYKGITSQSIKKKEEQYEAKKQEQINEDAKIAKIIKASVQSGEGFKAFSNMVKQMKEGYAANKRTVSTHAV